MGRSAIAVVLASLIVMLVVTPGYSADCPADIDGNGVVDGSDLAEMALDYGSDDCPEKTIKYITCDGALSSGGRWCNNADGTVTDMTTGLVWLQDASWGGQKAWRHPSSYDDAHTRAGILKDSMAGANLSDGSVEGDWRLPTKNELDALANGSEAVRTSTPRLFTGVQSSYYWSSTTTASYTGSAWSVEMHYGYVYSYYTKQTELYVWPVRGSD